LSVRFLQLPIKLLFFVRTLKFLVDPHVILHRVTLKFIHLQLEDFLDIPPEVLVILR
jgi:hypothetical protein